MFRLFKRKSIGKYYIRTEYVAVYVGRTFEVWPGSNDHGLIRFDQQSERFDTLKNCQKKNGKIPNVSRAIKKCGSFTLLVEDILVLH